MAAATQQHCKAVDLGIASDKEDSLTEIFDAAIASDIDMLFTSGGVSMGDRDFVKPCLARIGNIHFEKVGCDLFMIFFSTCWLSPWYLSPFSCFGYMF